MKFQHIRMRRRRTLTEADPGYLANLIALGSVERALLLDGHWKIRLSVFRKPFTIRTIIITVRPVTAFLGKLRGSGKMSRRGLMAWQRCYSTSETFYDPPKPLNGSR